ncbi:2345_t:CDS:1, partial [Funneliformis mosseae]
LYHYQLYEVSTSVMRKAIKLHKSIFILALINSASTSTGLWIFVFEIAGCIIIGFIKIVARCIAVDMVVVFSIHFV